MDEVSSNRSVRAIERIGTYLTSHAWANSRIHNIQKRAIARNVIACSGQPALRVARRRATMAWCRLGGLTGLGMAS